MGLMTLADVTTVEVREETVYWYSDSEFAEIGNPRGERYREVYLLIAEAPDGMRWQYNLDIYDSLKRAERSRQIVQDNLDKGRKLQEAYWDQIQPMYGSKAYQIMEPEIVQQEREEDYWNEMHGY